MRGLVDELATDIGQNRCQRFFRSGLKVSFMALYLVLVPVHLFSFGVTVVFDAVCLVKEGTSVVNCSQKVIIDEPEPFVILFCLTNLFNAVVLLTTLHVKPEGIEFCGFRNALKKLSKKGSFWSLNILFVFVIVEYIIAVREWENVLYLAVIITHIFFICSRLIVVYFMNYLQPVKYQNGVKLFPCLIYWITLVSFFLDTTHVVFAVTLDVAEKVTLLGKVKLGSHDFNVVFLIVLFGLKATFEARLFMFFWNKMFHGDKDLFSSSAILQLIRVDNLNIQEEQNDVQR